MGGPRVLQARVWSWRQLVREAAGDEEAALELLADMSGYGEYQHVDQAPVLDIPDPCVRGHTGQWVLNSQGYRHCNGCSRDRRARMREAA